MTRFQRLRGAAGLFLLVIALIVDAGVLLFVQPLLLLGLCALCNSLPLLHILGRKLYQYYRVYTSSIVAFYLAHAAAVIELVYGVNVVVYGDPLSLSRLSRHSLLISNHPTRLDWALLWPVLARSAGTTGSAWNALVALRILLKSDLRSLPFLGWALQMARFVFLERKWEADESHMARMIALIRHDKGPNHHHHHSHAVTTPSASEDGEDHAILLFPEGTDLAPSNRVKSAAFSSARGLVDYNHILHPRTKGFVHTLSHLRHPLSVTAKPPAFSSSNEDSSSDGAPHVQAAPSGVDGVEGEGVAKSTATTTSDATSDSLLLHASASTVLYDLTIAYAGAIPQTEAALVKGAMPEAIHVGVAAHSITSLPLAEEKLESWLLTRFAEKEAALRDFYGNAAAAGEGEPKWRLQGAAAQSRVERPPGPPSGGGPIHCNLTPLQRRTLPAPMGLYGIVLVLQALLISATIWLAVHYPWLSLAYVISYLITCAVLIPSLVPGKGIDKLEARFCIPTRKRRGGGAK